MSRMEMREETKRRPLYQRTAEALSEILESVEPGTYLPSEPKLARSLGVSRATLREAMRIFERRGMIVRRQGVGTYVTQLPHVIDTGIETLDWRVSSGSQIGSALKSRRGTWKSANGQRQRKNNGDSDGEVNFH
jgi:DNA-binding GntR family transcriptional regulator